MSVFEEGFDDGYLEGYQQANEDLGATKCEICGKLFISFVRGVRICEHCKSMGYD